MRHLLQRIWYRGHSVLSQAAAFVALAPAPPSSQLGQLYGSGGLGGFINNLFRFALAIGAIAAVLRLAYAGYLYMGSDMWTSKSKAREVIGDVTLGLLLLLAVYLILFQINPDIVSLKALQNIGPVPRATPSQPLNAFGSGATQFQPSLAAPDNLQQQLGNQTIY